MAVQLRAQSCRHCSHHTATVCRANASNISTVHTRKRGRLHALSSRQQDAQCNSWPCHLLSTLAPLVAAGIIVLSGSEPAKAQALEAATLSSDVPVLDAAKLISTDKREALTRQLQEFERETGWRLRIFTTYGADGRPTDDELRSAWQPNKKTVVINFDASNPNLINPLFIGDEVLMKLRRPWWFELQSRFGNLFFVREEGEQAAVLSTMAALTKCLGAPEGCAVVPGLPSDQYYFTLALSIVGGLVAGSVTRLEPTGWVKSRWAWLIVFSPVWASLFINFGLGPIISRTDEINPILANTAGFLIAAVSPYVISALLRQPSGQNPEGQ